MKRIIQLIILVVFQLIILCGNSFALTVDDYLILSDISGYEFVTQMEDFLTDEMRTIPGYTQENNSGILAGTDHFSNDHTDISYKTDYYSLPLQVAINVQVTQHTGGDSDQWLLHEVERGFRSDDLEPKFDGQLKEIIGNKIFSWKFGTDYRWKSNNVVVVISYNDSDLSKPEPLEIVHSYLQKFPSTIPATLVLDRAHDEQWIKDEMARRLWLGDKWFTYQAANNTDVGKTLREVNNSLIVFLNYRYKYYGITGSSEIETLQQLLSTQNIQGMKDKLTEYKSWWTANKSGSINLP